MSSNTASDFLALRKPTQYFIERILPFLCATTSAYLFGLFPPDDPIPWPGILLVLISGAIISFDTDQLAHRTEYRMHLYYGLFVRSLPLALVTWTIFKIDPLVDPRLQHQLGFVLATWFSTASLSMAAIELGASPLLRRPPQKIAVVAITPTSIAFAKNLVKKSFSSAEFMGFFEDRGPERVPDYAPFPVLCKIRDMAEYLSANHIDHIVVCLPTDATMRFQFVLEQLFDSTCSIHYLHDFLLFKPIREGMTSIGSISVFTIIDTPHDMIGRIIKRLGDIIFSAIALILLSPLFLVVSILVKLDSKGPVFFRQNRWGTDAEPFVIYKFRSMTMAASASGDTKQATKGDARVTKLGAFLRRSSIDELPQLANILLGSMSFVGPRPHAIPHNQQYRSLVRGYMLRHKMKPGLTGWAQVNGCRGETDTVDKMKSRVEYDLDYLRTWTPWLDFVIVMRTIKLVLSGLNAY